MYRGQALCASQQPDPALPYSQHQGGRITGYEPNERENCLATITRVGIAISNRWNMNLIIGSPEHDCRDRIYKVTGCYGQDYDGSKKMGAILCIIVIE